MALPAVTARGAAFGAGKMVLEPTLLHCFGEPFPFICEYNDDVTRSFVLHINEKPA